jgi:hypothetical protein
MFESAVESNVCIARNAEHVKGKDNIISDCASRDGAAAAGKLTQSACPNVNVKTTQVEYNNASRMWLRELARKTMVEKARRSA